MLSFAILLLYYYISVEHKNKKFKLSVFIFKHGQRPSKLV